MAPTPCRSRSLVEARAPSWREHSEACSSLQRGRRTGQGVHVPRDPSSMLDVSCLNRLS